MHYVYWVGATANGASTTLAGAVEALKVKLGLGRSRVLRLHSNRKLELTTSEEARYCEIIECNCSNIASHGQVTQPKQVAPDRIAAIKEQFRPRSR